MKFGAIMQACRVRAGLSQEEMAELLNRTQSCISKIENDHKIPDMTTLLRWVEVTGTREVLVAFLYGMDGLRMIQNIVTMIGGTRTI
ncbi:MULTISPECIES: helix-turn-helix domain-containing protein [Paenibacillus]|uniref:XRE family transcriptional regulator n=3 Tax=Paenibacillus TaxID=44249 RepID=E3E5A5_PAEPS|nr:helix-turn-helix transcriptional regulator [Paenibacillus polymyxa]ADO57465.2 XRE family transcriptional regulator [Paenibacillus polymyxa SC2]WPQ55236.1 helix-turn-helix transcriptional regulator [Paenibacillus polymyxa]